MKKEEQIIYILYYLNEDNKSINNEELELTKEGFSSLLHMMERGGLIEGTFITYEDDEPNIDLSSSKITIDGIKYLNEKIHDIIERNILQILYDHRYKSSLTDGQIKREVFIRLRNREMDSYLNILRGKGLLTIEKKRIQAYKHPTNSSLNIPASTSEKYRIAQKGIEYVDNNFIVNSSSNFMTVIDKVAEIADNTAQTNCLLSSISKTFDMTLNSMGLQNQKIIQQHIETNNLLEKYLVLLKNNDTEKGNKLTTFLSKLSGDIVVGLIVEASKKLIG